MTIFTCQSMIPGHGDLSIEWPAENADKVEAEFDAMIKLGVDFWIVEKAGPRSKVTVTEVTDPKTQLGNRKAVIRDEHIGKLVRSGLAELVTFEGVAEIKPIRKAYDAREASRSNTVASGPRTGG